MFFTAIARLKYRSCIWLHKYNHAGIPVSLCYAIGIYAMSTQIFSKYPLIVLCLLTLGFLAGCAGMVPLSSGSRAGDTIALGAGWKHHFDRNDLTATITDSAGNVTTYPPGSPSVRAIIDLYPDPLSFIVVGTRTGLDGQSYNYGKTYGGVMTSNFTSNDPDWWQTTIYMDLPTGMETGDAQVSFSTASGESYGPIPVNIIPGTGSPSSFSVDTLGSMSPTEMHSMERAPMSVVSFDGGSTLADSIQIDLTHDPDSTQGGTGKAFVVNPRGEMKNLSWTDDGSHLRVLLMTSGDGTSKDPYLSSYMWKYFKFYVTGGVTNVQVQCVKAYDQNGNALSGTTATVAAQ